ncbi:unnamed protein product, partial [Scytosiphon promiscuus]
IFKWIGGEITKRIGACSLPLLFCRVSRGEGRHGRRNTACEGLNVFGCCGGEKLIGTCTRSFYSASRRQGRLLFQVQKCLGRPSSRKSSSAL